MKTLKQRTEGVLQRMEKIKTKKRISARKKIAMGFVAALIVFFGGYTLFSYGVFNTLKYDRVLGSVVHAKISSAQILPEENAFKTIAEENIVDELKHEEYAQILENLSLVEGKGAGKYLGYDMYELKNEYLFVLEKAPVFDQWFQFDTMREDEGYVSIPYYENWYYFIKSDAEAKNIEITSVSWRTRFSYYDFDKNEIVEDYNKDESIIQYQVMKVKFYEVEENQEVVESTIYGVAVDKYKSRGFAEVLNFAENENFNKDKYKPLYYTKFINIKDKSLIKYTLDTSQLVYHGSELEYDIRNVDGNGTSREFIYLNYQEKDDIVLLRLDQAKNTSHSNLPQMGRLSFYSKLNTSVQGYFSTYDYYDEVNSTTSTTLQQHWQTKGSKVDLVGTFNIQEISNMHRANSNALNKVKSKNEITRGLKSIQTQGNSTLLRDRLNNAILEVAKFSNLEESVRNNYLAANGLADIVNQNNFMFEENIDLLIESASSKIVKEIDLKNDWDNIFKGIEEETTKLSLAGEHDPKKQPVANMHNLVDGYYNGSSLSISASAELIEGRGFDENNSLSLVLMNEHGDMVVLASSYNDMKEQYYSDGELYARSYKLNTTYNFGNLKISKAGTYTLKFVLTSKNGNEEVLAYDLKQDAYLIRYFTFDMSDTVNADNTVSSYEMTYQGRKLQIKVEVA